VFVTPEAAPVTEPASELVTELSGVGRARVDEMARWAPLTVPTTSPGVDGPGNGMVRVGVGSPLDPPRSVTPRPTPPRPTPPRSTPPRPVPPRPVLPRPAPPRPAPPRPDPPTPAPLRPDPPTPADAPPRPDPIPPTVPPTLGTPTPRSCAPASVGPRHCSAPAVSSMPMVRITSMELGKWPPPGRKRRRNPPAPIGPIKDRILIDLCRDRDGGSRAGKPWSRELCDDFDLP
jgi:hypothetical protein